MNLTATIGDTQNFSIPLRWRTGAFVPGTAWTLTFTVKSAPDTQADAAASFQKTSGGGGITTSGPNATVEVLPEDTNDLTAGTYYWDIQATNDDTGAIRTVASGELVLTRDVTREPGVTLDVNTVSPPLLYFSYVAYVDATTDDPVLTEAEWVMVTLKGYIESETAPENTQYPWFDPSDGTWSVHNGNAWVVTSGLGATASGGSVSDAAYDEADWNGVTTVAPSKNAVRDRFEVITVAPVAVANAAARKLASTYVTAGVTLFNGLQVIQDDLPDVVWTVLDITDITDDVNWFGAPRTDADGQLPLNGVKMNDGNVPFSFARYIPAASADWFPSSSAKYIRLFEGITIPASLVVAGNKISVCGTVRGRKDSSGLNSLIIGLTFQKPSYFDFIEANPSTTTDTNIPVVFTVDTQTTLEWQGHFHAIFTLTAVTGYPDELRLVADTNFSNGGQVWSFTTSAYTALSNPTADGVNTTAIPTNITAGEDLDLVIAIKGGANVANKTHQIAISGGINVYVP